jgi:hypothetical protein
MECGVSLADVGALIAAISTLVLAAYAALGYHMPRSQGVAPSSVERTRGSFPRWVVILLVALSWGGVGFDFYDRHYGGSDAPIAILQWGIRAPLVYEASIDGDKLIKYKNDFKLMLIVRVPFADKDRMTDRTIEKSSLYTIEDHTMVLAHPSSGVLRFIPLQSTPIDFDVALVPINISSEEITCLSDVVRDGGKLIAHAGANVIGGPPQPNP